MIVKKRHGWLVGALLDAGYQQQDLAKAWGVDSAVVSRFISSGKPDLTPERQMILSGILGMTNDQLLSKLYGGVTRRAVTAIPGGGVTIATENGSGAPAADEDHEAVKEALQRLRQAFPGARVNISITYD